MAGELQLLLLLGVSLPRCKTLPEREQTVEQTPIVGQDTLTGTFPTARFIQLVWMFFEDRMVKVFSPGLETFWTITCMFNDKRTSVCCR